MLRSRDEVRTKEMKKKNFQPLLFIFFSSSELIRPHFFTQAYILTPNSPLGRSLCLACLETDRSAFSNSPSM